MKLTEVWVKGKKPTISFELFPARNEKAAERLEVAIANLADLHPDFMSVTFGAGGSTREGSRHLLKTLKTGFGLEVVGYFAGYGLGPDQIVDVLDSYQEIGVENILVVRGDIPHDQDDYSPHPDSFAHANELVEFIRPKYDFCLGVAGYPEGHIDAVSKTQDLEYLKVKVDHGAEYIITNYCYDNQYFFDFVERCQAIGINVPIVAGVMPIYSVKMMESLAALCGATITNEIRQGLAELPAGDKAAVNDFGIEYAYRQCKGLINSGVPGIHIYTMDRSKSVVEIVSRLRSEGLL